ncbi:MAG TPA: hypothetical protein VGO84_04330, partial [Burkholderiales bacterium]|nr:hypothetical protein [Burkholderiales bacterium]
MMSGRGLAADAAMVVFPLETFLPGSNIDPVVRRKEEFYTALTSWTPAQSGLAKRGAGTVSVSGASADEAHTRAANLYISKLWGDGLPLVPATAARVDWILRGSALPRKHILGKFPPRGGVATIEAAAIALAMAGGRPEYLPVLLAAVDAFLDPHSDSAALQADSGSVYPVIIVNGPIARQIRLNDGFGCLGPDPQHPAGASIGRALRLMQQNLGGALPGIGAMAMFGAMRYTNAVFAEDETALAAGWPTHAAERHGYAAGTNSVSLVFANGVSNIKRRSAVKESAENDILQGMHRIADVLRGAQLGCLPGWQQGTPGVLMIPQVIAEVMAKLGWTRQSIREFLWEHSKVPMDQLRRSGALEWIQIQAPESSHLDPWPIAARADNFVLVVAGGGHPTN